MKRKNLQETRQKSEIEIRKLIEEKSNELSKSLAAKKLSREKNVRLGKSLRRDIAQLKTILHERQEAQK